MGFFDKVLGPTVAAAINGVRDDLVKAVRDELSEQAPKAIDAAERLADKYAPQVLEMLRKELGEQAEKWMPILFTGLSKTVTETMVKIGSEGVDKLTDMTPTERDDQIIDPIANQVFSWLGGVFGGALPPGGQRG